MSDLGFIHRFVPASDADQPILLLLHGTGGNEDDLLDVGGTIAPGAALLSPRGRVLERGMPRFFRRLAEGVFDLKDLKLQTALLAKFVTEASLKYGFSPGKVIAVGYSNGANIAGSVMLTDPQLLAGAVLFRPMVPFIPDSPPNLGSLAALLSAGRRDPIVAPEQTLKLAEIFESGGAEISIHWHEGGHELGNDDIAAARKWIERWRLTK